MIEDDPIEQARRERAAKERAESETKARISTATKEYAERLMAALQGKCGPRISVCVQSPVQQKDRRLESSKVELEWGFLVALQATDLRDTPYHLLSIQPVKYIRKDADGTDIVITSEEPDTYWLYESHYYDRFMWPGREEKVRYRDVLYSDLDSAIKDIPRQAAQIYMRAETKLKQERVQKERTAASHQKMADRKIEAKKARYRKYLPINIAIIALGAIGLIAALVL